jgi:hypothetical protein
MQFTVFWDVTPCSFISTYKRLFRAENGGSRFLRNAGTYLPSYMSSHATVPAAVKVKSRSFYFYRQTSNTTCKYRMHLLPFPRARQLYRTASLYPPAYPVTTAVLRGMIEETLYCSLGKSRHTAFQVPGPISALTWWQNSTSQRHIKSPTFEWTAHTAYPRHRLSPD